MRGAARTGNIDGGAGILEVSLVTEDHCEGAYYSVLSCKWREKGTL
jgi:hypothetical protein